MDRGLTLLIGVHIRLYFFADNCRARPCHTILIYTLHMLGIPVRKYY